MNNHKNILKKIRGGVKRILTAVSPQLETTVNYRFSCGKWIDWRNPNNGDINAKLNWLKVKFYYNNEAVTSCIDKYLIRFYLEEKGLAHICPRLYGVYEAAGDIAWDMLPHQFALKCNHACGTNIIVKNKDNLDTKAAAEQVGRWMKMDYWKTGEVQYRFIKKRIVVEEYLGDGEDLKTVKFFCFNGEPKVAYLSMEEDRYLDYYDMSFNKLPYSLPGHEHYPHELARPDTFDEMVRIAGILSEDFPFVRVDLYDSKGKIYISELTFIPTGGYMKIDPPEVLEKWGEWLDLCRR